MKIVDFIVSFGQKSNAFDVIGGNIGIGGESDKAAIILGISRGTLYKMLKQYNMN